jgi:hypothetical protein
MFKAISDVYNYYRETAEKYRGRGLNILKTDTHNESGIWGHSIPLAPILADGNTLTCIEIDPGTLSKAKSNYPDLDFRAGDIQTWEGEYDVVLDFSTIDHVEDYYGVLENYRKIGKEVSVIVWLNDGFRRDGDQFWFPETEFREAFQDIFGEHESQALYGPNIGTLYHFLCPGNT